MTEHITGQQARELLDGTTRGPWTVDKPHPWEEEVADGLFIYGHPEDGTTAYPEIVRGHFEDDADLIAAAPALAETVAWLYGQTGQDYDGDWQLDHHDPYYQFAAVRPDGEGRISLAVGPYGQEILLDPDEAVEVARALLTAAEDARRHTD